MHHLACVSFLNSKPLIDPVLTRPDIRVHFAVPSQLPELMKSGQASAGLLSIVDFQSAAFELQLLPAGMIGCDGPTLTVRIFSRVEPAKITTLHADTDSHTSVILAQLILREQFGVSPDVVPLAAGGGEIQGHEALLLIGDKVVNAAPDSGIYPHQLDLGHQWKVLTDLPFVFAMWMVRRDLTESEKRELGSILADARRRGADLTERLIERYAAERHWPADLARQYFTSYLRYDVTAAARKGLERFFDLAGRHNLLAIRRPVEYFEIS